MSRTPRTAKSIFLEAVENHRPDHWSAFLAEACGDDAELRARVDDLLQAHGESDSLLDQVDATVDFGRGEVGAGATVGPYKLRELIGEGGMGAVYVADQESPVRRRVALKVIKPGMDTQEVIARFEAERQALAMMDHPSIAKVFDAGMTDKGRPYFVMELINGVPITAYCDDNKLSIRERLELFVPVCQAIQHAHQKGVIHRDVKPSNVLITLHDGQPVPVVIDFGVAKATNQGIADNTVYTRLNQVIGTTLYMSPEQAELSRYGVDTRTDIYSLGVLLYELLTGTTPFDRERLCTAAFDEVRRIIREEDPPRPSLRVSTLGDEATGVSIKRKTEPARLRHMVRGDLDWIVMKSLEKDRSRRYESSSELAKDVLRHLNDDVVLARPPSAIYSLTKYARRHHRSLGATAVVLFFLILIGVLAGSNYLTRDELKISRLRADANEQFVNGRYQPAAARLTDLLKLQSDRVGRNHADSVKTADLLARTLVELGETGQALGVLEDNLEFQLSELGKEHSSTARTTSAIRKLAIARSRELTTNTKATQGDYKEAVLLANRAVELSDRANYQERREAELCLVEAMYRTGEVDSANQLAEELLSVGSWPHRYQLHLWLAVTTAHRDRQLAKDWLVAARELYHTASEEVRNDLLKREATELIYGDEVGSFQDENLDTREELELLARLLEHYPLAPDLLVNSGYRRVRLGLWEEAAEDFKTGAAVNTNSYTYERLHCDISRGWIRYLSGDEDEFRAISKNVLRNVTTEDISGNWSVPRCRIMLAVGCPKESQPNVMDYTARPRGFYRGLDAFYSENDNRRALTLLEDYTQGSLGAVSLLVQALAFEAEGERGRAMAKLQRARDLLKADAPMPGNPKVSEYTGHSNSVRWCEAMALLVEVEKKLGDYSEFGKDVINLRDARQDSQPKLKTQ